MSRDPKNNDDQQTDDRSSSPSIDWVDKHGDSLFRFAMLRVGNQQLAEDLVQETFLAALKTSSSFAGRSSERTWLISILKRKIVDHYRQSWRTVDFPDEGNADSVPDFNAEGPQTGGWKADKTPRDWGANPEALLENKELGEVLISCIDALPKHLAGAFALREMEGWETEEICKEFSISASNLWVILHRARTRLRSCLEAKWFDSARQKG
jgi:RNA polymerase sigma-70 factor (TIGR02943 family)